MLQRGIHRFDYFAALPHTAQAFIATLFTWGVTALGAAAVFLFKRMNKTALDAMLGFRRGRHDGGELFLAARPAASQAEELGMNVPLTLLAGFLGGGALLMLGGALWRRVSGRGGGRRSAMLVASITLHNIPEGLSVGVAFGSLAYGIPGATLASAAMLALGIGPAELPGGPGRKRPAAARRREQGEGLLRRAALRRGGAAGGSRGGGAGAVRPAACCPICSPSPPGR